jgi:hypothetical protein
MDDLTPWEEINPPMASAPLPERRLPSSAPLAAAPSDQFRDELTACLALVVPSGMEESARREWLLVAWKTLSHLPTDLLKRGCDRARKTADHPSKIVPAILREVQDDLERRRERINSEPEVRLIGGPRTRSVSALRDRRGGPGPMTEAASRQSGETRSAMTRRAWSEG